MYLSNKHKLLFIAVPRTASNSVQQALINSDITDSSDVVYSLKTKDDQEAILNYHLTPSDLVKKELISSENLNNYKAFGFVRNPFDRWVSNIFLARHTGALDKSQDPLTQMCKLLRSNNNLFKSGTLFHRRFTFFKYTHYFFHKGTQVVDAYRFEDVEAVTKSLVPSVTDFPHVQVNTDGVPAKFKEPIETWLPEDCYKKIQQRFENDLAFYNSIKAFNE